MLSAGFFVQKLFLAVVIDIYVCKLNNKIMNKDKITFKVMMHYEQVTGKNALELLTKITEQTPSATQLIHIVYMYQLTKDINTSLESVIDYSQEQITAVMQEINS